MNVLQAIDRLENLRRRAETLSRMADYIDGDPEFRYDRETLLEMESFIRSDIKQLETKLAEIRI